LNTTLTLEDTNRLNFAKKKFKKGLPEVIEKYVQTHRAKLIENSVIGKGLNHPVQSSEIDNIVNKVLDVVQDEINSSEPVVSHAEINLNINNQSIPYDTKDEAMLHFIEAIVSDEIELMCEDKRFLKKYEEHKNNTISCCLEKIKETVTSNDILLEDDYNINVIFDILKKEMNSTNNIEKRHINNQEYIIFEIDENVQEKIDILIKNMTCNILKHKQFLHYSKDVNNRTKADILDKLTKVCKEFPSHNSSLFDLDTIVSYILMRISVEYPQFTITTALSQKIFAIDFEEDNVENIIDTYIQEFTENIPYIVKSIASLNELKEYVINLLNTHTTQNKSTPYSTNIDKCVQFILKKLKYSNCLLETKSLYGKDYYIIDITENETMIEEYFNQSIAKQMDDDKSNPNTEVQKNCLKNEIEQRFNCCITNIDINKNLTMNQFLHLSHLRKNNYSAFFEACKQTADESITVMDKIISKYNNIINCADKTIVDETYNGEYLKNNCLVPNQHYSPLYKLYVNRGHSIYRIKGQYYIQLNNKDKDSWSINKAQEMEKSIVNHFGLNTTLAKEISLNENNTINCSQEFFNVDVNAKFYIDSRTSETVLNTCEDFPYPFIKNDTTTDTSVIDKSMIHLFKNNEDALHIWERKLLTLIQSNKAPKEIMLFVTNDTNGEAVDQILFHIILKAIFLINQCLVINDIELTNALPNEWKDNFILLINDILTALTDIEKQKALDNLNIIKQDDTKHILKLIKTCDVSLLGLHKESESYIAFDIDDNLSDSNYLGYGTLLNLQEAVHSQIGAYYHKLKNMDISTEDTNVNFYNGKFIKYLQTTGNRVQSHVDAYLKFDSEFFEYILTGTDNMNDRQLLLEIKKSLGAKKPYASQQLIIAVLIATEKISLSRKDITASLRVLYPKFFSENGSNNTKASTFMGKTTTDQKYWLQTEYNPFYTLPQHNPQLP